jgi:hypothetical protein
MRTLEERERLAYISGRVEEAALLATALDAVELADDELRHEADSANSELEDAKDRIGFLESLLDSHDIDY